MDEQEAIRLSQGGDEAAFRFLVETHQGKAYRLARMIVGDCGIAEDVAQDAFLSAWRGIHTFQLGLPFSPWLCKIVVRCALRRLPKHELPPISDEEAPSHEMADPAPGPETRLCSKELNEMVKKAISQLSPQRNRIITLHYYGEQKISEIAELLNVPEGTVKSELYRAKKELNQMLKGVLDHEVE